MIAALDDLPTEQRELIVRLARGVRPEDIAWVFAQPPETLLDEAREALRATAPELADALPESHRNRIADYVLGLQSPGQAAGTKAVLESSAEARRWGMWLRELLCAGGLEPPAIPGLRARPARQEDRHAPRGLTARRPSLSERREAKRRRQQEQAVQAKLAKATAHYRPEALEHHRRGTEAIKLPHFVSRPTIVALWITLACLAGLVAFAAHTDVPAYVSGPAVIAAPADATGRQRVLALFPPQAREGLRPGAELQVKLPQLPEHVRLRVRVVEPGVLSPREVTARYELTGAAAASISDPSVVAAADLRLPRSAASPEAHEGATGEAKLRLGTERLLSLLEL